MGSKREGSEPDEVLGSLGFGFLICFLLSLVVGFEVEVMFEVEMREEGDCGEAILVGTIDLRAGLTVEGSNEGSVAICFASQVL